MRTFYAILALVVSALTSTGCTSSTEQEVPLEADRATIVFRVTGGLAGVDERLTVDPAGLAIDESVYPALELQLTAKEHDSLLVLLSGFTAYQDSYPAVVIDGFQYTISLRTAERVKTVDIDEFAFQKYPELRRLAQLVAKLSLLRARVFRERCQWLGLQYRFSLDSAVYHAGSMMTVSCRVNNPTTTQRTLYFRNNYHLQFAFSGDEFNPSISATIPFYTTIRADTSAPHQVVIAPGAAATLTMSWNQSFTNGNGVLYSSLPEGLYTTFILVPAGGIRYLVYAADHTIKFRIVR